MDPIIFEFAMGIAIGAVSELFLLRRSGKKTPSKKTVQGTRPASGLGSVPRSIKTPNMGHISIARPQAKPNAQFGAESDRPEISVSYSEPHQSSCPTCGLSAPDKLMAEHLLGSPLHRKRAPAPLVPQIPRSASSAREMSSLEEDSRESLRNLLQMLVPPRAFGRRHVQGTTNPLAELVSTAD